MDDWEDDLFWDWDDLIDDSISPAEAAEELAGLVFLSDGQYLPVDLEDYRVGYLEPKDWWPLVNQLDEMLDLGALLEQLVDLDDVLGLEGVPSELLEDPLGFLATVLDGELPREASGRRVGSRKLVKIGRIVTEIVQRFPETARSAVRAWADVHRSLAGRLEYGDYEDDLDLADLLLGSDLPPAMTGFSMMIAMTLMHWPERAEGLPLPPHFADPDLYDDVLAQWQALPDSSTISEDGTGGAEALFAQGQLAHMLAQMGAVELMAADDTSGEIDEGDMALAYSRLSRSILWVHDQCRHCPEREGVSCKAATHWMERPVPLLDVAGEIANTSRIQGCIKM